MIKYSKNILSLYLEIINILDQMHKYNGYKKLSNKYTLYLKFIWFENVVKIWLTLILMVIKLIFRHISEIFILVIIF
jgi:hypothetical protein